MNQQIRSRAPSRKWIGIAIIAAVLASAYVLGGFVLLPWIAERSLSGLIEEHLHHRARVGAISFNPFTLRLQAREFALETIAGGPVFAFTDATVDLEWRSLTRGAWVLDELRLVNPSARLELSKEGRLNLAALAPDRGAAPATPLPNFAIARLAVVNGSIDFEDLRQGYRNRLEGISIDLSSLSTLGEKKGPYMLAGRTPGGAALQWKGELSLAPLEATGTLAVGNVPLADLMPYVDEVAAMRIVAGRADLELPYRFALTGGQPRFSLAGAKLEVRDPALASTGQEALLVKPGTISLGGVDFDWTVQRASARSLRIGESTIASGKDNAPLAKIGALTLDGAAFEIGTRRASAATLNVGGIEFAATEGNAGTAALGPFAIEGLGFDPRTRRVSARALNVAGAVLTGGDGKQPLAKLGQLALEGLEFDFDSQSASAKGLRLADLALALERGANGDLDLARLWSGKRDGSSGASSPAWRFGIDSVEFANASANYTDLTAKTPLALAISGLFARFKLEASSGAEGFGMRLEAEKLSLAKLDAVAASAALGAAPALRVTDFSIDGTRFNSAANTLEIQSVRIGGLGADTLLEDGRASLLDLLPKTQDSSAAKPLSARIRSLALDEGSLSIADRTSGIAIALDHTSAKLRNVSTDPNRRLRFEVSTEVRSGGRIALRGRALPAKGTLEAQVDAKAIAMAPLQPLLSRHSSLALGSGDVSLSGALRIGGDGAKFTYSGAAHVANVALDDPAGARLIGWKSVSTELLKATLSPDQIEIDELRFNAPAGRLAIAADGTSNLSRAFARKEASASSSAPAAAKDDGTPIVTPKTALDAEAAEPKPGDGVPFSVTVRRVRVEQGALDFSDDSLSPRFVAKIYELAGTANGLSSDQDTRSQFSLEGRVDEFGYARLSGSVNLFAPRNRSTFRVQLRNIDLAGASPYAMRFAGYRIASGHLALDLNYRVRTSLIEGDNKITLQDFKLGEHVESPDALKLPFELAIGLLKEPDGTINLEVPVRGNLDDPQFSLAPLIWKAIGNLIGNVIAAPFRALAHLFGGASEDNAGMIAFDPGRSRLLPPEREKLGRIAQGLSKRPEVKLLIPARYDAEADARAMKRAALGREIGRRAGFAVAEDEEPGPLNLQDKPTRAALRALFAERFSRAELDKLRGQAEEKARAAGQPPPSVADRVRNLMSGEPQIVDAREFYQTLLRRLREEQPLASDALAELARQRGLAIETALKAAGADASRIAQTTAEPTSEPEAKQIKLQLSLTAR
ncbi:MAG: DUF748 domain-containing protein [Betaproteobacteria bacterium]|nr:DUF748 domain-containing protein [Betaproteobacteria bacterium]